MKITVFYIGSSLLAPLKYAEREINRAYKLDLKVSAHNFGALLSDRQWQTVQQDVSEADVVFVIHVMDGENASRLVQLLQLHEQRHQAVVVINCMPELMKRLRMGKLDVSRVLGSPKSDGETSNAGKGLQLVASVGSWVGRQASSYKSHTSNRGHGQYLKLVDRLPGLLRFVPNAGALRDAKNYLYLFCYFLQPTPNNIRSMLLYALKHYTFRETLAKVRVPPPEARPAMAIYHPDSQTLFESFSTYEKWYRKRGLNGKTLHPSDTIGLLLMRPQVISRTTKHYDALIRAVEREGLSVIPSIATLMDNREACERFFAFRDARSKRRSSRVSQIVSLTGFSFVGGPAMNDSDAATGFLRTLNRPYRSAVSLDMQSLESWRESFIGLNPVQAGMQIAIPEIDGATEPFIYGGIASEGSEPEPLEERCERFARRIKRWNRLQTASRSDLKLALVLFCFPPNKGNIGTAADLDVFPSVWVTLQRLQQEGYTVPLPSSADELRESLLNGNSDRYAATTNIAHRMTTEEYRQLCPYVDEIEKEWGRAPGKINSFAGDLIIQGLNLGNVFIGVQPTFGFEGDPMRLMMARGSAPHHGFMAFYTYISKVLKADAVVHIGTHGSLEFMPGKQLGLSGECWPDRLIGDLPNIYLYSVNNPSEGSIAKRRSYAELISYLTPPMENAGLYKELASLKEMVNAYRESRDNEQRERLFAAIESSSRELKLHVADS